MLNEVVVTATPLNASSPKTTYLGGGVYLFSGGSWGTPFPSDYSSPGGRYKAAPGSRTIPHQPRNDAPRSMPPNPKDGAVVYIKGEDGTTTQLVYNQEYGAWVMPELLKAVSDGDIEIQLNEPVFNGAILMAIALPAGAVPGGQIVVAGAAIVVGAIAIYNLAQYYNHIESNDYFIPRAKDLPWEPGIAPGPDWTWEGEGDPLSGRGSWVRGRRPGKIESLHPDLDHPEPIGPHWDYIDQEGNKYRVYPDGTIEPK